MGTIVTLTTDFGLADAYAGVMKGVILSIAPEATVVDLCHGIAPQDIAGGALAVEAAVDCFPPGSIHVVVVDPGVGSQRAAVAVRSRRHWYVGPDNGVLSLALQADPMVRAVSLTNPRFHRAVVSATFHGRDIFAPAAAYLASGVDLMELGDPLDHLAPAPLPPARRTARGIEGEVIHVDRFGNLVTNIRAQDLAALGGPISAEEWTVHAGAARISGVARTYADVAPGSLVAYVGSSNRLEIAVRNGSAAERLGARAGWAVTIEAA